MQSAAKEERLNQWLDRRDDISFEDAVEAYLPLARLIARKFLGRGVEGDDLEQVASLALCDALKRFSPDKGAAFPTFATHTIAGKLRNHIRDKAALMRVPRAAWEQASALRDALETLDARLGRAPTAQELSAHMNIPLDSVLMLLSTREGAHMVSLDAEDDEGRTLAGMLAGDGEHAYDRVDDRDFLRWALDTLSSAERRLLELRYKRQLSQRETAHEMNISQMQVSRMERRALERLRTHAKREE